MIVSSDFYLSPVRRDGTLNCVEWNVDCLHGFNSIRKSAAASRFGEMRHIESLKMIDHLRTLRLAGEGLYGLIR